MSDFSTVAEALGFLGLVLPRLFLVEAARRAVETQPYPQTPRRRETHDDSPSTEAQGHRRRPVATGDAPRHDYQHPAPPPPDDEGMGRDPADYDGSLVPAQAHMVAPTQM